MRLHNSKTSPYVRKVHLVLHETGQMKDVVLADTGGTPLNSSAMPLDQNPLGKIPVLERPDGPALYDSRVICQYLSHRAQADLYPAAPALWEVLTIEATADGILDAALGIVYETRLRPEHLVMPELMDGYWEKIARAVAMLDTRWMAHLNGPLTMAHLAVGAALGYLDFRHDARNWRADAPKLAAWYEDFAARPSMQASAPVG